MVGKTGCVYDGYMLRSCGRGYDGLGYVIPGFETGSGYGRAAYIDNREMLQHGM